MQTKAHKISVPMRSLLFKATFALMLINGLIAQNVNNSLIVVHFDPASKVNFKQIIYKYNFLNGSYTGREELLSVQGRVNNKDYIRTDLGNNMIYKNRYLITGIGNIIDLKEKKVLLDQRLNLVRCSNDSAIYYTNDIFKGKHYSVYNFTTKTFGEVKSLTFKAIVGQDVEFDKTKYPYTLTYYPMSKPKVLLTADAGYGQTITNESRKPDPTVWWLDNTNFIYTQFNKDNTEIAFVKMNVDTKAATIIGKGTIKQNNDAPELTKVGKSQAIYSFGEKKFMLDADKNTVTELIFTNPENNFSVECKYNSYGHIIKLNGKDIGKQHFKLKNFKTDKDIAAIVKELVVGSESYQQGLGVWNNSKQAWATVDAEDVIALVGWITPE